MPKLRIGTIPTTRLRAARLVRDKLRQDIGDKGYAVLSITNNGFSVCVGIYEGNPLPTDIPKTINGVYVMTKRAKQLTFPKD